MYYSVARRILVGLLTCTAMPAWAQTTDSGTTEPAAAGEIIVTATKREESAQRVGSTIAAFGSDTLQKVGSGNPADLVKIVPGLTFAVSPNDTPVYTLRGVGFYETSLAASPAVSVYVDQVPLPFPVLTQQAALDVQRVEVLKGPQGILFGSNSTGGAINYVANRPTKDLEAGFSADYGRFNAIDINAYVSGPITDTLRARIAIRSLHADDWQYSYTRKDSSGQKRLISGRATLDWTPTEKVSFTLTGTAWHNASDPEAAQYIAADPTFPDLVKPEVAAYPFAPNKPRAADWSTNSAPRGDANFYQMSLRSDIEVADNILLTTLSAYSSYNQDQVVEGDGINYTILDINPVTGKIKSFFQEVRFSNEDSGPLHWVVGGNFEHSHVFEEDHLYFSDSSLVPVYDFKQSYFNSDQKMRRFAAFGNVDYEVVPGLKLKAGLRYTQDKTNIVSGDYDTGDGLGAAFFERLQVQLKGSYVPIAPGGEFRLDQYTFNPSLTIDELKQDNVSFRVGADWQVDPTLLLYANISRGYKSGGFPTLAASTSAAYKPVTQESVLAYEAGIKAQPFGRSMSINAAAFYYDYTNKQLKSKILDPVFGALDALVNIPKSRVAGGEASVNWRPVRGLSLSGSVTYVDTKIERFSGVNAAGVFADFAGAKIPYSPKWQTSTSADYEFPIGPTAKMSFGGSLSYNSRTSAVIGDDPRYVIRPYALLDLRAGVSLMDDTLSISIYGRNVTNKFYWTNVAKAYDVITRYAGMPVTYGVRASYRFK